MNEFFFPILGGMMIGLGSLVAMIASGKVPGISGVFAKILRPKTGDVSWRIVFLLGLVGGAGLMIYALPGQFGYEIPGGRGLFTMAIAGLLVGYGARLGGGCTSGHGVCGIGSLARDAIVYTLTFMGFGMITVWVWNLITSSGV